MSSLGPVGVVWVVGVVPCTDGQVWGPVRSLGGRGLGWRAWSGLCARSQNLSLSPRAARGPLHAALSSVLRLAAARPALQALPLLLRRRPAGRLLRAPRRAGPLTGPVTPRTRTEPTRPSLQSAASFFGTYTQMRDLVYRAILAKLCNLNPGVSYGAPTSSHAHIHTPCTPNPTCAPPHNPHPSPCPSAGRGE